MTVTQWIGYARKALIAATAALGIVAASMLPDSDGGSAITGGEWIKIAIAVVGALGVYAVANTTTPKITLNIPADPKP